MSSSTTHHVGRRMLGRWVGLAGLIAIIAVVAIPASASAAACPVNPGSSTTWIGGSGSFNDDNNWSNGGPSNACDVFLTSAGSDTVTMTAGANMKSFTLGGVGSMPTLIISVQSPNTNLNATATGITIAPGASVTLTCPPSPGECSGGSSGGAHLNSGSSPLSNAGTIKVDANSGIGAVVDGVITNTGTMTFEKTASLSGQVVNKGLITVGNGATVTNAGSSCGGTEPFVKNDTGGTISGVGTGVLSVFNFEQGNGTTGDVVIPCGSLKYTGTGASEVAAFGGFNLSGEMRENQGLTISAASPNTKANLTGTFINKGSIILTCPAFGCDSGATGGAGFNVAGNAFTNAGTFSVSSGSGSGSVVDGNGGVITNTGTMTFEKTASLSGQVVNKGVITVGNGATVTNAGSSCGGTEPFVKNDTGGTISGVGTGVLSVFNFEQGNGTTGDVVIPCGSLKYSGNGTSKVQASGGFNLSGEMQAGQELTISAASPNTNAVLQSDFTNKGSITLTCPVFGCSGSGGGGGGGTGFNANGHVFTNSGTFTFAAGSGTDAGISGGLTNTGTVRLNQTSSLGGQVEQTGAGAEIFVSAGIKLNAGEPVKLKAGTLRGGGTIIGSVENSGGVVAPGASPGALTLTGNYVQGPGGRLDIEVAGTGAGQFDSLAVGGVATLGGTLALIPTAGFADSSAVGDSVSYLTYGGSLAGGFSQTTVNPPLSCGKAFSTSSDTGAKALKATVVAGGASCSSGGGNNPPPSPPAPVPDTKLNVKPKATVKTKQAKAKVKFGFFSPNVKGATFQCKLDKGGYKACASPKSYKLKPGKHTFSVRAIGPGGTDPTPATAKFKVVREQH